MILHFNHFIYVFVIVVKFTWKAHGGVSSAGVVRVEDVPGEVLGLLPHWRLFQEAI